jgi:hypothetical protein
MNFFNIFIQFFFRPLDLTYRDLINQYVEKAKNLENEFKK